ncbi:MAG: N-acetyltransferase family protein [Telluria sp.]
MTVSIRPLAAADETRWRELFIAYCHFYEWNPSDAILAHTWARIMDPAKDVFGAVACDGDGAIVGIMNYLLHENTTAFTPVCYLQDLFVDPGVRAGGIGKALIDWLIEEMKRNEWSRLYWNTRATNYRARGLYDKYAKESGFVRYVLANHPIDDARLASEA